MDDKRLRNLRRYVNKEAYKVFSDASKHCDVTRHKVSKIVTCCLKKYKIQQGDLCIIAVGSLGRLEALEASDLDLIPILKDKKLLSNFAECDAYLRKTIADTLNVKVSKGESLTKADTVSGFADSALIGGDTDSVTHLTKRVLILTESVSIGGKLDIRQVRNDILRGYGEMHRTRGRHVLSLVNDIARYFRTLCIEYKGKVDADGKDWCTRNLKLRYSRKLWYFANLAAIVTVAERFPRGERAYQEQLLQLFEMPPYMRLLKQCGPNHAVEVGRILECFSVFLEFMSCLDRRSALERIDHSKRYSVATNNPFPALKYNSDLMHSFMVDLLEGMNVSTRRRVIDWFLL
jgi:hypothetical protein